MSIEGNIKSIGLANIIEIISESEKSGILVVENHDEQAKYYFRYGILVYGALSGTSSQLGNILLNRGIVTEEELARISTEHKSTGKPLGQISEELGIASKDEIRFCMQLEAEDCIFEVLSWDQGTFRFTKKSMNIPDESSLAKPSDDVLLQAKTRLNSIIELRNFFPHFFFNVQLKPHDDEFTVNVNLTAIELKILSLLTQPILLRNILKQAPTDTMGTIRVVKNLIDYDLIEIESVKPASGDFKTEEIKQYVSFFEFYFGLFAIIFNQFKKVYEKGAWKVLAQIYNKVKRRHPRVFDQVMLEAEGHLNSNTILGNVAKLDHGERKIRCAYAMNHYFGEQLLMVKNYQGTAFFPKILEQCREYTRKIMMKRTEILDGIETNLDTVIEIISSTPTSFERGLQYMMDGDFDAANNYLKKVSSSSSDYHEAQVLIRDLESQARASDPLTERELTPEMVVEEQTVEQQPEEPPFESPAADLEQVEAAVEEVEPEQYPKLDDLQLIPIISDELDINGIQELPLLPDEVFLLTRIDGTADLKGLVALSQMSKDQTLHLLSKFHHHGYIQLHHPRTVREMMQQPAQSARVEKSRVQDVELDRKPAKPSKERVEKMRQKLEQMKNQREKVTAEARSTVKEEPVGKKETGPAAPPKKPAGPKSRKDMAREHYNKGMKHYTKQDYENATKEFEKAIENNPTNVVYYNMLNEAKSYSRRSRGSDFYHKGLTALKRGDVNTALQQFKEALKLDQNDTKTLNTLAEVLSSSPKTLPEAEKYIRKAIEVDFANPQNYVLLGRSLKQTGKFKEAREAFEMALEWDRNNKDALKELRLF